MVPRELKKMTTDRHTKAAIRARMEFTKEPYSVAARAIAALPIRSGWFDVDWNLGDIDLKSLVLIVDPSTEGPYTAFTKLALNLMEPNRRVLVVAELYPEDLIERMMAAYLREKLVPFGEGPPLTEKERARIGRHLAKNLVHMDEFNAESIIEELRSNPGYGALLIHADSWLSIHRAPDGMDFFYYQMEQEAKDLRAMSRELSIPSVVFDEDSEPLEEHMPLGAWRQFDAAQERVAGYFAEKEYGGAKWAESRKLWGTQRISMGKADGTEAPEGEEFPIRTVPNPVAPPFEG